MSAHDEQAPFDDDPVPVVTDEAFRLAGLSDCLEWQCAPLLDPSKMVEAVVTYLEIEQMAMAEVSAEAASLIDWHSFYACDCPPFDYANLPALLPDSAEWTGDLWVEFIKTQYELATGLVFDIEVLRVMSNDIEEAIEFMSNPTQEIAASNPILKHIPDFMHKVRLTNAHRSRAYAARLLEIIPRPVCLRSELVLPDALNGELHGRLECWMFLAHEHLNITPHEFDDVSLFNFSAVFLETAEEGEAKPIAVVSGYHLHPLKGQRMMSEESFAVIMDAHSAHLNDVWKVIVGKFMPRHGMNKLEDLYAHFGGLVGFAAPSLAVASAYRGKRLSKFLLGVVSELTECAVELDYLAPAAPEGGNEFLDIPSDSLSFAPIKLFVLGIEGTPPEEGAQIARPHLAYDPTPMGPRKVVDAAKERVRIKLSRYFESLNDDDVIFKVVTYNPWDYSIT